MIRIGTQPEEFIYWNQYRFLPRPPLYVELDECWLDIAGWDAFDDLNGYNIDAPDALPSGCSGAIDVQNVPREWERHAHIQAAITEYFNLHERK